MTGSAATDSVSCETSQVSSEEVVDDAPPADRGTAGAWAPPPAAAGDAPADGESFGDRVRGLLGRLGVAGVEVPFDTLAEAARWWFSPLADVRTWKALASLVGAALVAPLWFGLSVTLVVITAVTSILVIGLLLVPAAFGAIAAFAGVTRRLAEWPIDRPIEPRPVAAGANGVLGRVTQRLTDEARWRQVALLLVDLLMAPLLLGVAVLPISMLVGAVGAADLFNPFGVLDPIGLVVTVVQVASIIVLAGAVGRLAPLAAVWRHRYVATVIGRDRETELAERVEELSVQRDQVVDAVAAERRRIERNLHDGVQQQLVALGIDIGRAQRKIGDDPDGARELLDDAREKVRSSIGELRLIGRGLHPAVLGDRGLDAALSSVVSGAPIPISVDVGAEFDPAATGSIALPPDVNETAYYVASEAVANILKYAQARVASIRVERDPGLLPAVRVTVHDDGRGGADEVRGSGIAGMRARVEAVDGAFRIDSPPGGPTVVTAVLPLRRDRPAGGDTEPRGATP